MEGGLYLNFTTQVIKLGLKIMRYVNLKYNEICQSTRKKGLSSIAIQDKLRLGFVCSLLLEGSKNRQGESCSNLGVELNGRYSCSVSMIV